MNQLLSQTIDIARQAGDAILEIYNSAEEFEIEDKEDQGYISPLTKADEASHKVIDAELKKISKYTVISEEGSQDLAQTDTFWLVDPLDGTKEFISRNGEFTVNIGLIKNGKPVLGVVYQPVGNILYAAAGNEAFKVDGSGETTKLQPKGSVKVPKVVVSRNHKGEKLEAALSKIGPHEAVDVGSSLKFCLLAEGSAQVYPRMVPTYLWDTAAADAVLRATGGEIRSLDGKILNYNPWENRKNPLFIATAKDNQYLFDKIQTALE